MSGVNHVRIMGLKTIKRFAASLTPTSWHRLSNIFRTVVIFPQLGKKSDVTFQIIILVIQFPKVRMKYKPKAWNDTVTAENKYPALKRYKQNSILWLWQSLKLLPNPRKLNLAHLRIFKSLQKRGVQKWVCIYVKKWQKKMNILYGCPLYQNNSMVT